MLQCINDWLDWLGFWLSRSMIPPLPLPSPQGEGSGKNQRRVFQLKKVRGGFKCRFTNLDAEVAGRYQSICWARSKARQLHAGIAAVSVWNGFCRLQLFCARSGNQFGGIRVAAGRNAAKHLPVQRKPDVNVNNKGES